MSKTKSMLQILDEYGFKIQNISNKPNAKIIVFLNVKQFYKLQEEIEQKTQCSAFIGPKTDEADMIYHSLSGITYAFKRESCNEEINKLMKQLEAELKEE